MARYLINLLSSCFEIYIANRFFMQFSKRRISPKLFWTLNIVFAALHFLSNNIFLSKSYLVMIFSLLLFFMVSLLYDIKMQIRVFTSIFLFIVFAVSEVCVAMLSTSLLKVDLSYTQSDIFIFAICVILSKFLAFAILQILRFKNKKNGNWLSVSLAFKVIPLPLSSFVILLLLFGCCYRINELNFRIFTLVAAVLLSLANILVLYIIDTQNDYIETKEQLYFVQNHLENQLAHYNELFRYQNELRTFRHDIKNRLLAILGLLENNNTQEAISLIKSDLSMLNEHNGNIVNTGNPIVDAVVQSKMRIAESKNIDIEVSTKLSESIKIDGLELGVLVGNALDNAIEATEKVDAALRSPIKLNAITVDDNLSMSVRNPVKDNVNTKHLTSSKADKHNHGYGLKSIESIVQKHNGCVSFSCEDNIFSIDIYMSNTQKQ